MDYLKSISFSVPGEPFGKERPRVVLSSGKSKAYTPGKTIAYENFVRDNFLIVAKNAVFEDGIPLKVDINAYFKIPQSASKKKKDQMLSGEIRPTKKPDFDNIGKAICDSLNGTAYHDDAAIVEGEVKKYYSDDPRVDVTISVVDTHHADETKSMQSKQEGA